MEIWLKSIKFQVPFPHPLSFTLVICGNGGWINGSWIYEKIRKVYGYKVMLKLRHSTLKALSNLFKIGYLFQCKPIYAGLIGINKDFQLNRCRLFIEGDPGSGCALSLDISIEDPPCHRTAHWDWKIPTEKCPVSDGCSKLFKLVST